MAKGDGRDVRSDPSMVDLHLGWADEPVRVELGRTPGQVEAARSTAEGRRRKNERRGWRKAASYRKRISKARRKRVYARDGYRCRQCGTPEGLTIDHVVPITQGGTNIESNLQTLCEPCNSAKGDAMPRHVSPAAVGAA